MPASFRTIAVAGYTKEPSGEICDDATASLVDCFQQYALQAFINIRPQRIWGRGDVSITAATLVFTLLHLPNLWLAVATFIGGLLWASVFQRSPNLFALALSHALMTIVLISTMPDSALHGCASDVTTTGALLIITSKINFN